MISFFKIIIYIPLYNALILILRVLPVPDIGIAVIILTILAKVVLYPLAKKASLTQLIMKEKQPELDELKNKYKDKQEQALKIMDFYRKYKINPFSSFLTVLIQIPIIYSLYHIFLYAGLPNIDQGMLYSFVSVPTGLVSMNFLGLIDIGGKNVFFALLAGITSFLQMRITAPATPPKKVGGDVKDDLSRIMALQMKYFMPVIVFFISWKISAVVALYWTVSNLLGIAQDLWIKRKLRIEGQKP